MKKECKNCEEHKQHPHAALIEQYARDAYKTQTPWEWWEMKDGKSWIHLSYSVAFYPDLEYRRMPQWEIDGFAVGDQVVWRNGAISEIEDFNAINFEKYVAITKYGCFSKGSFKKYEPPKTININGFEVPEPLREIEDGMTVYIPSTVGDLITRHSNIDKCYLEIV
jgi:hypothetical protein